jgi:uncharacterized membrane protein YoaK (UPF0700 family)
VVALSGRHKASPYNINYLLMDNHPNFLAVLWGGFLLAVNAGFVNALGILSLLHQAVSHLTGTVSNLGIAAGQGNWPELFKLGNLLFFFFGGAAVAGLIIGNSHLRFGRRYGLALMLQALIMLAAVYFLGQGLRRAEYLLALACGLQNGMATSYSGAVVRTSHMTGIVTDLGIMVGQWVRHRQPVAWWRVWVLLSLLVGFGMGGGAAVPAFEQWGIYALLLSAVAIGLSGVGYVIYYQVLRSAKS